jgi:hypothetical protein
VWGQLHLCTFLGKAQLFVALLQSFDVLLLAGFSLYGNLNKYHS